MSLDPSILAWAALALAVTVTPGPDTLLVAGHAARSGLRPGLAAVLGILVGGIFYIGLCGFGFLSLLAASERVYWAVKIVGAVYLAWIGVQMLRGALKPKAETAGTAAVTLLSSPVRQGFLTNVLNPKIAIFYLAALPQFVGVGDDAPAKGALLIAIHYALGTLWLSGIALAAARAGHALRETPVMRWIEGAAGTLLIGVAARVALDRR